MHFGYHRRQHQHRDLGPARRGLQAAQGVQAGAGLRRQGDAAIVPVHGACRHAVGLVVHMQDAAGLGALAGIDDSQLATIGAAQHAGITGLAAALRVEHGAVEREAGLADSREGGTALQQGGLAQLKLATYLNQPPLTQYDDKSRLATEVWQSLSLHSRRRLQQATPGKQEADPAAIYEMLEQLHSMDAA